MARRRERKDRNDQDATNESEKRRKERDNKIETALRESSLPDAVQSTYRNTLTHAIDGAAHEISDSEAWRTAWEAERDLLSENGRSKPSEGFAEFGELLLGSGITRKQIKQVMPLCLKAWEKYKL